MPCALFCSPVRTRRDKKSVECFNSVSYVGFASYVVPKACDDSVDFDGPSGSLASAGSTCSMGSVIAIMNFEFDFFICVLVQYPNIVYGKFAKLATHV